MVISFRLRAVLAYFDGGVGSFIPLENVFGADGFSTSTTLSKKSPSSAPSGPRSLTVARRTLFLCLLPRLQADLEDFLGGSWFCRGLTLPVGLFPLDACTSTVKRSRRWMPVLRRIFLRPFFRHSFSLGYRLFAVKMEVWRNTIAYNSSGGWIDLPSHP